MSLENHSREEKWFWTFEDERFSHFPIWAAPEDKDKIQEWLKGRMDLSTLAVSFPANAQPGGTYVISPSEANGAIPFMRLPDNFTIKFDPEIREVKWTIPILEYGSSCTIDLSVPRTKPPKARNGNDGPGQPEYGHQGADGETGVKGEDGRPGISLRLVFEHPETVGPAPTGGSLWIRTDGGPGGDGGDGGTGGLGGGSTCNFATHTDGGRGGTGGHGGNGGRGGDTSKVTILIASPEIPIFPASCSKYTEPSTRPPSIDDGRIIIWGSPGEGGRRGIGGRGGPGGGENRDCQWPWGDVSRGPRGHNGMDGQDGPPGGCGF